MKKILVPTDFSKKGENAIRIAASLSEKTDQEIILFHVINIPSLATERVMPGLHRLFEHLIRRRYQLLREFWKNLTTSLPKVNRVRYEVRVGDAKKEIISLATDELCDLIILGPEGDSISADALHAHCPVFSIPEEMVEQEIETFFKEKRQKDPVHLKVVKALKNEMKSQLSEITGSYHSLLIRLSPGL